jgi:transketolase
MDGFGCSGASADVFKKFGFTVENIANKGKELVDFYKQAGNIPDLNHRPVFSAMNGGAH